MEVFAGLSPTELDRLLDAVVEVRLPRGQAAFTQGEAGEACFVIRSGSFRVTRTREGSDAVEVIAERLSAGDVFGEMALLKDEPRAADVDAGLTVEKKVVNTSGSGSTKFTEFDAERVGAGKKSKPSGTFKSKKRYSRRG